MKLCEGRVKEPKGTDEWSFKNFLTDGDTFLATDLQDAFDDSSDSDTTRSDLRSNGTPFSNWWWYWLSGNPQLYNYYYHLYVTRKPPTTTTEEPFIPKPPVPKPRPEPELGPNGRKRRVPKYKSEGRDKKINFIDIKII